MNNPVDIVVIEDNEDYIEFMKRVIPETEVKPVSQYILDGKQALDYFSNISSPKYAARLVLLDLNLPGVSGIEILKKLKSDRQTRHIPVVIFSSSESTEDVKRSYDAGANGYVVKPHGLKPLAETMNSICKYWLSCNYNYS